MSPGTTDSSSTKLDDPVLQTAMAELATDGFQADAPVDSSTQDEGSATGPNPEERVTSPSDPATDGDAGPTAQRDPAQQAPDAVQTSSDTDDPLSGAEPVTITVDGQSRTLDGFYRIPGEGIVIDEEKVPAFQLMASRAEGLERQNRELYHRTQEYERLTQWTTKAPDGTDTTLTGRDGLEARDVELARTKAWSSVVENALLDPETFASLVTVNPQGQIVPNVAELRNLATRAELSARTAADQARSKFTQTYQATTQAAQQAQIQEQAPQLLWQSAEQAWAPQFPQLTPEDKQFLASQVPRYIRPANAAEIQAGQFKPGEPVLDPSFYAVMQDRAALRGQLASVATASTQASQFNARQQAGRRQAPSAQRPASSQPPAATPEPRKGKQDAWDSTFQNALQELAI